MARLAGVDIPKDKRLEVSLTYIYGVGRVKAKQVCKEADIEPGLRTHKLNDAQVVRLRKILENLKVEGDLRREVSLDIKRHMDLGTYRGLRHKRGLPVRGQSTRQNARTRKGRKKTVANKKKAV